MLAGSTCAMTGGAAVAHKPTTNAKANSLIDTRIAVTPLINQESADLSCWTLFLPSLARRRQIRSAAMLNIRRHTDGFTQRRGRMDDCHSGRYDSGINHFTL
jgi:hypothetical protein